MKTAWDPSHLKLASTAYNVREALRNACNQTTDTHIQSVLSKCARALTLALKARTYKSRDRES